MSDLWEPFKTAFDVASTPPAQAPPQIDPPPPVPDAAALKEIAIALIKRIPAAARGSDQKRKQLLALANEAVQQIKAGNLSAADGSIADLQRGLAAAEAEPIEDARPAPQSVAGVLAPASPVIAPNNLNAPPAPAVPAAQPAAPIAPPAVPAAQPAARAAHPVAPVVQPAAPIAPAWAAAQQEAKNKVEDLRKLLDKAVKFEPYLHDPIQYDQLAGQIAKTADRLDKRVSDSDKSNQLTDAQRITAYRAVAADAGAALAGFDDQIRAAQGKVAAQRKADYDALTTDEDKKTLLGQLAASRYGRQVMDDMVAGLGGSATTDQDKQFVKEALKARYKLNELAGNMDTKALPKFYKLLGMVPEAHTTGNDSLKKVVHNSIFAAVFPDDPEDKFIGVYKAASKEIVINLPAIALPWPQKQASGDRNWFDAFSLVTLHEVGHSVDDKLRFMSSKEGNSRYGSWKKENPEGIAEKVARDTNFYHAFKEFPKEWLDRYLVTMLKTGSPSESALACTDLGKIRRPTIGTALTALKAAPGNAGFRLIDENRAAWMRDNAAEKTWADARRKHLKDPPIIGDEEISKKLIELLLRQRKPLAAAIQLLHADYPAKVPDLPSAGDLIAMKANRATQLCQNIGAMGNWDKGPGGATTTALSDGRVYQRSYSNEWCSYELASRREGVSNYQFRAPGEWFAELYACYYLKKLPTTHPAYAWFKAEVDVDGGVGAGGA